MAYGPVSLAQVLAGLGEICSPRTVGQLNDYDLRVAHATGERGWHSHGHTDESFYVIAGRFAAVLRDPDETERTVELSTGDIFVVPRGVKHKPSSPGGAILTFEPSRTSTTGDRHEGRIPDYIDTTTGHELR
jgi:mannose-6-phosphate isomerase-like protein (cupin superfamily)